MKHPHSAGLWRLLWGPLLGLGHRDRQGAIKNNISHDAGIPRDLSSLGEKPHHSVFACSEQPPSEGSVGGCRPGPAHHGAAPKAIPGGDSVLSRFHTACCLISLLEGDFTTIMAVSSLEPSPASAWGWHPSDVNTYAGEFPDFDLCPLGRTLLPASESPVSLNQRRKQGSISGGLGMVELGLSCSFSFRTWAWSRPTGLISWYFQGSKTRQDRVPRTLQGCPAHIW